MSEKTKLLKDSLTPGLLKQVISDSLLKGIMTDSMVFRGQAYCVEDCKQQGIYSLDGNSYTTEPEIAANWNYGYLEVMVRNLDLVQRITNVDGIDMWFRVYRGGKWRPWYKIQTTPAALRP